MDVQKEQITNYCKENGHTIIKWVSDEGESGAKWRTKFDDIVNYSDNPPIQGVVVAKPDRVARDINIYFGYKGLLMRKNVQLLCVSEDFGQFGIMAPILEAFVMSMAYMERELIKNRTAGGRTIKASMGGYSGGKAPMGYKAENRSLVVNPEEVPIVKEIFSLRKSGSTMQEIVNTLNEEGYRSRSGNKFSISTVQSILNNKRTYQGYYHYGKDSEWVKGQHEAILKEEE